MANNDDNKPYVWSPQDAKPPPAKTASRTVTTPVPTPEDWLGRLGRGSQRYFLPEKEYRKGGKVKRFADGGPTGFADSFTSAFSQAANKSKSGSDGGDGDEVVDDSGKTIGHVKKGAGASGTPTSPTSAPTTPPVTGSATGSGTGETYRRGGTVRSYQAGGMVKAGSPAVSAPCKDTKTIKCYK